MPVKGKRHFNIIIPLGKLALCSAILVASAAVLVLLLTSRGVSSSESRTPAEENLSARTTPSKAYPERIEDVLARFVSDWPESPAKDRAAMARFFGFFQYQPALDLLRNEASRFYGESAVASVHALASLGDLGALPVFREIVRSPVNPKAIKVAAEAIGTWRDHHSYSTLILTLLSPHCEGPCVVALVQAMVRLEHPFLAEYLYLVHQVSSSSTARLASAAALTMLDDKLRWDRSVLSTLEGAAFAPDPGLLGSDLWEEQRFVLGLWGLGRLSGNHCRQARERAMKFLAGAPEKARPALASGILMADLPCIRANTASGRAMIKQLALQAGDLAPEAVGRRLPVVGPPERLAFEDPVWVDWLVQLATRFAGWQSTPSVSGFAQAIEQLEAAGVRQEHARANALGVAAEIRVPKGDWKKLKKTAQGFAPPEDFDRYDFTTGQPEWWPSYIDLTIDDGPRPKRLSAILDVLDKRQVKATFFFIGVNVVRNWLPDPAETSKLLNRVVDSGHRIGYHSMSHQTRWFSHVQFWNPEQIRDDIELFDRTLSMALGRPWKRVYGRLPGGMGRHLVHVRYGFHLGGLRASVHWNLEDENWGPATRLTALKRLAQRLVAEKKPTVILLHETSNMARQMEYFIDCVHEAVERERAAAK